jgi:CRP-like cAMP-binding protein
VIAQGQVEILSKGAHGRDLRAALLTEGEFFGEVDTVSDRSGDITVRTITPCVLLTLSRRDLDAVLCVAPIDDRDDVIKDVTRLGGDRRRAGHHCAQPSPAFYNPQSEIDRLTDAVAGLARSPRRRR